MGNLADPVADWMAPSGQALIVAPDTASPSRSTQVPCRCWLFVVCVALPSHPANNMAAQQAAARAAALMVPRIRFPSGKLFSIGMLHLFWIPAIGFHGSNTASTETTGCSIG